MSFNDLMRRVKRIEAEVAKMYGVHPSKVSMYSLEDIRKTADWKYIVEHLRFPSVRQIRWRVRLSSVHRPQMNF